MSIEKSLKKINLLTQEQYDSIVEKNKDELYFIEQIVNEENIFNGLDVKGTNPLLDSSLDTPNYWSSEFGPGVWWYDKAKTIWSVNSDYGFLISICYGTDIFQIFKAQREQPIYFRDGNNSGWGRSWTILGLDQNNRLTFPNGTQFWIA